VLLPATVAMGGTLAALERMMRQARGDTRVSAGVYGANTAGAVAGTLFSTFVLIPTFGFLGTLICLAGVNCDLCLGHAGAPTFADQPLPDAAEANKPHAIGGPRLTMTLFATGLLGIAFESWFVRLATQVMQDTVYTFAGSWPLSARHRNGRPDLAARGAPRQRSRQR